MPKLFIPAGPLGSRPVRRSTLPALGLEALEPRWLLSVSMNAAGYTVVTPPAGARIIYVSNSTGSDQNSGLSANSPVKSLHRAESLVRTDSGDEMLLKRGDAWSDSLGVWTASGSSAQAPIVVGAYGSGVRPIVDESGGIGLQLGMSGSPKISNVDFIGIDFYDAPRDPASASFSASAANAGGTGINIVASVDNLLIEDCQVQDYGTNINIDPYFGAISNVSIRRSNILDAYSTTAVHSEGLYANGVAGLLLEDNTFDHDGWNAAVPGASATIFNHDAYLSQSNTGVVVRGNLFADASSHGLQARSGGDIENNVFLDDPIGMSFGLVNGAPITPGGVSGIVNGNLFLGTGTIDGQIRGYGIEIGNTSPDAETIVSNNIFRDNAGGDFPAMLLEYGQDDTNANQAVGINDLLIQGNVVYDWTGGLSVEAGMQPGGTGAQALSGVVIQSNDFQDIAGPEVIEQNAPLDAQQEKFIDNRYSDGTSGSAWMSLQGKPSLPARGSLAAQSATANFSDATRSAASYDSTLGGAGTAAAFVAGARLQSSQAWQPAFAAGALVAYEQAGFEETGQPAHNWLAPSPPLPTVSLSPRLATTTDDNTISLSVTYTDNQAVDLTSLAGSNVTLAGPGGGRMAATLASVTGSGAGPVVAVYDFAAPAGAWRTSNAGRYTLLLQPMQVRSTAGFYTAAQSLGQFSLQVKKAPAPPQVRKIAYRSPGKTGPASLSVSFTSDVGASLRSDDLTLTDATGAVVPPADLAVTYDAVSHMAVWTFPGEPGATLAPGSYTVRLSAAIQDAAGRQLDGIKNGVGGDDFVWAKRLTIRAPR